MKNTTDKALLKIARSLMSIADAINCRVASEQHFDPRKVIGGYALHDREDLRTNPILWAESLCKEQAACCVPESHRHFVSYGRKLARVRLKVSHWADIIGYDYWMYIPSFSEEWGDEE